MTMLLLFSHAGDNPVVSLNFAGALPSSMTFARATTGTYFDAYGVLQTAAINTPRFDHDPATGEALGLLMEEQRTNVALNFSYSWSLASASLTGTAATSPEGTINAYKISQTATTAQHYCYQNYGSSNGTYSASVFLKAAEYTTASLWLCNGSTGDRVEIAEINLESGTISTPVGQGGTPFTSPSGSIKAVGNGWYRVTITGTTTGGSILMQLRIFPKTYAGVAGVAGSGIYAYGPQLEQADFPTSYIPTTSAAATRAADNLSVASLPWLNSAQGTLYLESSLASFSGSPYLLCASSATAGFNTTSGYANWYNGTSNITTANLVAAGSTVRKSAMAYTASTRAIVLNGGSVVSASDVPWAATPTGLYLGRKNDSTQRMNGYIRRFSYWNRAISSIELQRITQ